MGTTTTIILAAIIVAGSSSLSAWLHARQDHRLRAAERREDAERQDVASDRAAEQTRILIDTNERIAYRTAEAAVMLEGKLDVIHTLVNSSMTAAKQSEFDAIERELAMMKEVVALRRSAGEEPTAETLATMDSIERKLRELSTELAERRAQDALTVAQAANRANYKQT